MIDEEQRLCVSLEEQRFRSVRMLAEDAEYMARVLGFDVIPLKDVPAQEGNTGDHLHDFDVNPNQYVGHFLLPSGTTATIAPKISQANVFRMLAYVYARCNPDVFLPPEVLYAREKLLFEPLVQLFNELVENRVRRGLVKDYVQHENNERVLRGNIVFDQHMQQNICRPDRLFCRYFENTFDIEDNQIVKYTMRHLMSCWPWSARTLQSLKANLHQFQDVTLRPPDRHVVNRHHYHRLNDDYRLLHGLCRLFINNSTISERAGDVAFKGFLLDMNKLYEDFVTQAFLTASDGSGLFVKSQDIESLSVYPSLPVRIRPDITVRSGNGVSAVVDAKYKRTEGTFENHDFYQMVAYGTSLACTETYLVYPSSEWADDRPVVVKNSPITIYIRRFDLTDPLCVELAESVARDVLTTLKARAPGITTRLQPYTDLPSIPTARHVQH